MFDLESQRDELAILNHSNLNQLVRSTFDNFKYHPLQQSIVLHSNQALFASSLVGRQLIIEIQSVQVESKINYQFLIEIKDKVHVVTAFIYNDKKKLIRQISLGNCQIGLVKFMWDSLNQKGLAVPPGQYYIEVKGFIARKKKTFKLFILGNVDGVNLNPKERFIKLDIAGIGCIDLSQVKSIYP